MKRKSITKKVAVREAIFGAVLEERGSGLKVSKDNEFIYNLNIGR